MPIQEQSVKGFKHKWIIWGICISLIFAIIYTCFYDYFERQANFNINNPLESMNNIAYMYQNSYVLYRDLYNRQNQTNLNYHELYLNLSEKEKEENDSYAEEDIINYLDSHFNEVEEAFSQINATFDYLIEDTVTGERITNLSSPNISLEEQFFYVSFLFDEDGNVFVEENICGSDITRIRKNANEAIRTCSLYHLVEENTGFGNYDGLKLRMPVNCKVIFCINKADWRSTMYNEYGAYSMTDCGGIYFLMLLAVALIGFFFPVSRIGKPWENYKVCRPVMEIPAACGAGLIVSVSAVVYLVGWTKSGDTINRMQNNGFNGVTASMIVCLINILILCLLFCLAWYIGICLRELRELGIRKYIRQRWLFYRLFPYLKSKIKDFYNTVSHFDVTKRANRLILKVVLVNAVIVFIISSLWFGGFTIAVVYSVILYLILRKYISDMQKNYSVLLGAINKIAEGDLNVAIIEDLGVFEPFKPNVIRIQRGFQKAVDEEMKSQKMKSELITNVSHDLKTPLTAIITYVNLLKEENITEEQRKEYLDILSRKSLRLKVLIEDLFEVSKANSQNVTLNLMDVDIINLIKQVSFEMSDKMAASQLDVRMNLPEQKAVLSLDSQKTYRIYENLFGNIAKYSLPGTRVYVDAVLHEDTIEITLKNIAAEEISVNAEDLTERFVRGDASRNTEGSGLGLAIAKSFTELQNGQLSIQVDGDLFKVITVWKLK